MADDTTIIEGSVKFRDGKKWKSRWCVMRKLSPVADCVQLQLYRSGRSRGGAGAGRGACCAALSLARWLGAESGFTLDKHSNTLALVCRDLVAVLAFETRERLIQWQVKVETTLGASRSHTVVVAGGSGTVLPRGPARLHVRDGRAALTAGLPPRLLAHWEIQHLRRYGVVDGRFCLEAGTRSGRWEGLAVLVSDRPHEVARDFQLAARLLSPRRASLALKRTDGASSPSPGEEGAGGFGPRAGDEDTASLRGVEPAARVNITRCMSCMSKLGALSRSSTAVLTPSAPLFSPAWTMEAGDAPPAEREPARVPPRGEEARRAGDVAGGRPVRPVRPVRPARLELPRRCSCSPALDDGDSAGIIGPYENYDVPRVPSAEVEGEYYDTPKRLRECFDEDLFRITRSSTENTLILKKPCGCLLKFGKRRREPTVMDSEEEFRPAACPCRRVTDWAHSWIRLPYCRRNTASSEPSTCDKENVTPGPSALYATIDFSRKTRRKTFAAQPVEIDTGPLAHYENLNFALSLEYYENAKDMLRKAGVTQTEINAISANLKPALVPPAGPGAPCNKCGHPPRTRGRPDHDEYLMMEPNTIESKKPEHSRAPPAGYTPMSPIGGFAFHTLKLPARSPSGGRALEEKSASNPSLCAGRGGVGVGRVVRGPGGGARGRPRASSADSSRFLDEVKEFDGSGASSLETLRGAGVGKMSDVDSSEASKGREATRAPASGGCRDSSSSNDSGVSSWSGRPGGPAPRREPRAPRRAPPVPRAPRPRSEDAPRPAPPPDQHKSSSAEAEVPLLTLHPLRGAAAGDSRSTSSGASDMSDYIETLSLCSSHSSSDAPVTMRARVTSSLRPRSGKEYARLAPAGGLRPAACTSAPAPGPAPPPPASIPAAR